MLSGQGEDRPEHGALVHDGLDDLHQKLLTALHAIFLYGMIAGGGLLEHSLWIFMLSDKPATIAAEIDKGRLQLLKLSIRETMAL